LYVRTTAQRTKNNLKADTYSAKQAG